MTSQPSHLSRIDTLWSVVLRAHEGEAESARSARQALIERYGGAAKRYLRACLRDEDSAEEVFQEFALRMVRGDFRAADPQRGRFRSFVKTALHNLVVDFRRRAGRNKTHPLNEAAAAEMEEPGPQEHLFVQSWSQELLDRSWARLRESERVGGAPYYSALRLLVDDPNLSAAGVAWQLTAEQGSEITAGNIRVVIHRARQMFADFLVAEVVQSLESSSREEVQQELGELSLLPYCQIALSRHFLESADSVGREAARVP